MQRGLGLLSSSCQLNLYQSTHLLQGVQKEIKGTIGTEGTPVSHLVLACVIEWRGNFSSKLEEGLGLNSNR